ncbi:MAG: hypothetical protein ABIM98_07315 [candidate division WOR-3 bacterium]
MNNNKKNFNWLSLIYPLSLVISFLAGYFSQMATIKTQVDVLNDKVWRIENTLGVKIDKMSEEINNLKIQIERLTTEINLILNRNKGK